MKLTIAVSPWRVTRFLIVVVLCLLILSVVGQFTLYFLPDFPGRDGIVEEFNIDAEGNFPSMYSALTLLLCSILLAIIAQAKKVEGNRYAFHWKLLAFIFLYLCLDEGLSLHEHVITPLRKLGFSGFLYHAWVVPAALILPIIGLLFLRFLFSLPSKTRRLFIIACCLFIGGAMGMEVIGGNHADLYGEDNLNYEIIVTIEEFLEMLGIIVFLHSLLSYMNRFQIRDFGIRVQVNTNKAASRLGSKEQSL
ncbi:MAG: hypothetical protein F6J98_13905 [Moorea sp. SIO4G2]|nr:hypothetical protein [Moorena sp. SIO4G2]